MAESLFDEMKRYVRFGADDQAALIALRPWAEPHFERIVEEFYARLNEHEAARRVFIDDDQVQRLHGSLVGWLGTLLSGPWDADYFNMRARIGRRHVKIDLPQRYMFGAMDLIRIELCAVAASAFAQDGAGRDRVDAAIAKILDLELAIMLDTYREASVEKARLLDRLEKATLEQRLALSEAKYEQIVEKAEALIITVDADGGILLFNRRCEEVTGIDRDTAVGRNWLYLFAATGDRSLLLSLQPAVLSGQRVPPYDGRVRHRSGVEHRIRWHFTSLPSDSGPTLCAIGIDVTEEHELGVRTRRNERLASLGTMAAGLAHEIRNPLNAAHLQLALLQRRLARPGGADVDSAREAASVVSSEMDRLASLVQEFLRFARPQPLRMSRGDLRATAEQIVALVALEAQQAGITLSLEAGPGLYIEFDEEGIKQVMLNLVRNALDATLEANLEAGAHGGGGHVRVVITAREGEARLAVTDNGPGIPADAPIFEPFFTTKSSGTGLGLSIVHRIVSDHGGRVDIESRPGQTTFSVCLPMTSDSSTSAREDRA